MRGGRIGLAVLLAAAISSCADPGGRVTGGSGLAPLRIRVGQPQSLVAFQGPVVERIRAYVIRIVNDIPDTIATGTANFGANANSVNLQILVPLQGNSEDLQVTLLYQTLSGVTLFIAQQTVTVTLGGTSPAPTLQPFYAGPGQDVDSIAITPVAPQMATGDSLALAVAAFNGQRLQMPAESVYVNWSVSAGSSATVGSYGVFHAPSSAGTAWVYARTPSTTLHPNGLVDSTLVTYAVVTPGGLTMTPDSVEKLPRGTQAFTVSGAPARSAFIWSVNGVDGGNSTFGLIDSVNVGTETAYYTAPAVVPNQPLFQVCARLAADATTFGCAKVLVSPVPSAGADVIVFNDMNLFDNSGMDSQTPVENRRLVENLLLFASTGPRNTGTAVMHSFAMFPTCLGTCGPQSASYTVMDSVTTANGFTIAYDTVSTGFTSIPSNVKVLFLWQPTVAYSVAQINVMKQFAAEGGRIVFIGEHEGYYGAGIPIQNQFLLDMGAQMTNIGQAWTSGYTVLPDSVLRSHQVMTGITQLTIAAASEIVPGPNDFILFMDPSNTHVLAGVAKISTTPLPAPLPGIVAPRAGPAARPSLKATGLP